MSEKQKSSVEKVYDQLDKQEKLLGIQKQILETQKAITTEMEKQDKLKLKWINEIKLEQNFTQNLNGPQELILSKNVGGTIENKWEDFKNSMVGMDSTENIKPKFFQNEFSSIFGELKNQWNEPEKVMARPDQLKMDKFGIDTSLTGITKFDEPSIIDAAKASESIHKNLSTILGDPKKPDEPSLSSVVQGISITDFVVGVKALSGVINDIKDFSMAFSPFGVFMEMVSAQVQTGTLDTTVQLLEKFMTLLNSEIAQYTIGGFISAINSLLEAMGKIVGWASQIDISTVPGEKYGAENERRRRNRARRR